MKKKKKKIQNVDSNNEIKIFLKSIFFKKNISGENKQGNVRNSQSVISRLFQCREKEKTTIKR